MRHIQEFLQDEGGTTAVEYAVISTLLTVMLLAIIELSFVVYQWQAAEKATVVGARKAAVTALPSVIASFDGTGLGVAVGTPCMSSGSIASACSYGTIVCTNGSCGGGGALPGWSQIIAEMQAVLPNLTDANVQITYAPSGLGYVGMSPLPATITVSIVDYTYSLAGLAAFTPEFAATITIPPSPATIIGESEGAS